MATETKKPETVDDYRALLLEFIGSLTLADHMGDVSNDIEYVLKRLGLTIDWDDLNELGTALGKQGVTTLYGTSLYDPSDDEDEADD